LGELLEERLSRYERVLQREYENTSIIPEAVRSRWYDEDTDREKKFERISVRVKSEGAWFTDLSVDADLVFSELARTITLHEEKYLISRISSASHSTSRLGSDNGFEGLIDAVYHFRIRGYRPTVLFLPIEVYVSFNEWVLRSGLNFEFGKNRDLLQVDSLTRLTLMWSNKFVPFEDTFIVDPTFGEWIYKRDELTGSALGPKLDPGREVMIGTEFHFMTKDPGAVVRLSLPARRGETQEVKTFLAKLWSVEEDVGKILSHRKVAPTTSDPATLAKGLERVDPELGGRLRSLVDTRNRIVHQWSTVSSGELALATSSVEDLASSLRRLGPAKEEH
jgi:hypothetical protein